MMMMKAMKMIMRKNINQVCSICGANSDLTEHHLIPKSIQNRKKIKNTKSDSSESKMTSSMTRAYASVLLNTPEKYLWDGVYFVDMDGDKNAEMILPYGTCEADATAYVYKYKSGKAVKVGKFSYGHKMLVNYPGHKGLICMHAHMGYEEISVVYLKNGKVKSTSYGERNVGMGDYLSLKPLNNHLKSGKWNL